MLKSGRLATSLALGAALAVSSAGVAAAQDEIQLDYWELTHDAVQTAALQKVISDFEAANPGITVNMEQRGTDEHKDALRVAAGTDAAPDIYFMWAGLGLGGEFVNAGASDDISDLWAQFGWDDRFIAPVIADATQYGGYHGVPSSFRSENIYYKKDVFEQYGLEEPTTYEELVAIADTLTENGVYAFAFGGTVDWHLMRLLDQFLEMRCGAEGHDALTSLTANWAESECATQAFEDLALWSEKYLHPALMGINNDEATQLFFAGQSALALEGDWFFNVIEAAGESLDDYDFFPFPTGTDRLYSFSQMTFVSPNLEEAQRQAAARFLDFASSPEVQQEHLGVFAAIPLVAGVALPEDAPQIIREWAEHVGASEATFSNNDQSLPLDVTTEYWRIQNLVASGELAPGEAGAQMQTFIDNR